MGASPGRGGGEGTGGTAGGAGPREHPGVVKQRGAAWAGERGGEPLTLPPAPQRPARAGSQPSLVRERSPPKSGPREGLPCGGRSRGRQQAGQSGQAAACVAVTRVGRATSQLASPLGDSSGSRVSPYSGLEGLVPATWSQAGPRVSPVPFKAVGTSEECGDQPGRPRGS